MIALTAPASAGADGAIKLLGDVMLQASPFREDTCANRRTETLDRRRRVNGLKATHGVGRFGQGNVSESPKGRPRKDDATPAETPEEV